MFCFALQSELLYTDIITLKLNAESSEGPEGTQLSSLGKIVCVWSNPHMDVSQ